MPKLSPQSCARWSERDITLAFRAPSAILRAAGVTWNRQLEASELTSA